MNAESTVAAYATLAAQSVAALATAQAESRPSAELAELEAKAARAVDQLATANKELRALQTPNSIAQQMIESELKPVVTPTPIPPTLQSFSKTPPRPPSIAEAGAQWLNPTDGALYMHIPPRRYSVASRQGEIDATPEITSTGYWIKKTEVTNGEYELCFNDGACVRGPGLNNTGWANPEFANHPVTNITYDDAQAYAKWVGGYLPTRDEWEIACAGEGRRTWPWGSGDGNKPTPELANFNNRIGGTKPVGSYPKGASPFGVLDMAGNVYEITNDKTQEGYIVIRGGGINDESSDSAYLRCSYREGAWVTPGAADDVVGFRVVIPAGP